MSEERYKDSRNRCSMSEYTLCVCICGQGCKVERVSDIRGRLKPERHDRTILEGNRRKRRRCRNDKEDDQVYVWQHGEKTGMEPYDTRPPTQDWK